MKKALELWGERDGLENSETLTASGSFSAHDSAIKLDGKNVSQNVALGKTC